MISVEAARRLIDKHTPPCKKEIRRLEEGLGFILAKDLRAPFPLPQGDNSAMDGFAVRSRDTKGARGDRPVRMKICGVVKAGDSGRRRLKSLETCRIMTGALLPLGADSVIAKEEAAVVGKNLPVCQPVCFGRHVRRKGEEIKKGERVLGKHSLIHPATVGILAMLGKDRVKVFRKPGVWVISTGNELVRPGAPLPPGRIYDSNSLMMASALRGMGIVPAGLSRVKDEPKALKRVFSHVLRRSDVVILMGGVSVGDYDFVKEVLRSCGVRTLFWGIRQKPGKPLYFGRKGRTLVFGLPGNPASVFTCFYEYVYPALRALSGFKNPSLGREKGIAGTGIRPDRKKFLFLKARTFENGRGKQVVPLGFQGSHMISSLQEADSFALVPPGKRGLKRGETVFIDRLPLEGGGGR